MSRVFLLFLLFFNYAFCLEEQTSYRVNYFGNIMTSTIDEDAKINNYLHDSVDNKFSFTPYTKFGAQLNVEVNDNWFFKSQALAQKNLGKNEIELSWINGKYRYDDNFSIQFGRIPSEMLLHTNGLDIDYLHLWSKEPDEVYRIIGFNRYDGVQFSYNFENNGNNYNLSFVPKAIIKKELNKNVYDVRGNLLKEQVSIESNNAKELKATIENDNYFFKLSYISLNINLPYEVAEFTQLKNSLQNAGYDMSKYSNFNKDVEIFTAGLKYDDGLNILSTEFVNMHSELLNSASVKAYYAMIGRKFGKFTPYYMFARNKNDSEHFYANEINSTNPAVLVAKQRLENVLYSTNLSQQTHSLGLRYDFKPGIALKMQIDQTKVKNYGNYIEFDGSNLYRQGIVEYSLQNDIKKIYQYTIGVSFAF